MKKGFFFLYHTSFPDYPVFFEVIAWFGVYNCYYRTYLEPSRLQKNRQQSLNKGNPFPFEFLECIIVHLLQIAAFLP